MDAIAIGNELLIPAAAALAGLLLGLLFGRGRRRDKARVEELEARVSVREGQIAQLEAIRADMVTRIGKSEQERDELSAQLTRYRNDVVDHFSQTSELLKDMTLQYRNIYQHLAQGAEALCPEGTLRLETNAPIEGLHAESPPAAEGAPPESFDPALDPEDDDDGASVEAAHQESPVQVDPRPEI